MSEKIESGRRKTGKNGEVNENQLEMRNNSSEGGRTDAVSIFPEEIWGIIFGYLPNWRDLKSCSKTCILFEKVLRTSRTTYLFKPVYPHIFKHLPLNDILHCRSVSKAWRDVVDSLFDNHPSLRPHSDKHSNPRHPPFGNPMKVKKLDKMFRLFRSSNLFGHQLVYPFIGHAKAVMIGFNNRNAMEDRMEVRFWNSLYKCLEANGHQLWYFKVVLLPRDFYPRNKQRVLYQFLTVDVFRLAPNLRKLHISGSLTVFSAFDEIPTSPSLIPSPSYLETLQFDTSSNRDAEGLEVAPVDPHPIVDVLLNKLHTGLRKLHVEAKTWASVSPLGWGNLSELHIQDLTMTDAPFLQIKFPNLKKLGLSLKTGKSGWTLDKFLELLNQISILNPLLNTLRIYGGITSDFANKLESNLYAPQSLKTLEVEHVHFTPTGSTCYTFLLRFPSIQNVNVFWRKGRAVNNNNNNNNNSECERSEIQLRPWSEVFHANANVPPLNVNVKEGQEEILEVNKFIYESESGMSMYKSNIWELLPKLKVFTFQEALFTRGEYENLMERRRRFE